MSIASDLFSQVTTDNGGYDIEPEGILSALPPPPECESLDGFADRPVQRVT